MVDVDELLLEWEERQERGEALSAEAFSAGWPAHAAELRRRIGLLQTCAGLLALDETDRAAGRRPGGTAPARVGAYEVRGELGE